MNPIVRIQSRWWPAAGVLALAVSLTAAFGATSAAADGEADGSSSPPAADGATTSGTDDPRAEPEYPSAPELTVTSTATPAVIAPGGSVAVGTTVVNTGSVPVDDLRVYLTLPAGFTVTTFDPNLELVYCGTGTGLFHESFCTLGTLAPGDELTLGVVATAGADAPAGDLRIPVTVKGVVDGVESDFGTEDLSVQVTGSDGPVVPEPTPSEPPAVVPAPPAAGDPAAPPAAAPLEAAPPVSAAPIEVSARPAAGGGQLAYTGVDVATVTGAGLLLLVAGAAVLFGATRRRKHAAKK